MELLENEGRVTVVLDDRGKVILVSEGEMDALLLVAREESTCTLAIDSFHRCVLPSMNEVKRVKEECASIDAKKYYLLERVMRRLKWIGLTLLDSEA